MAEVWEGAATLAAFGTGRGCTEENYKGAALAILRSGTETGKATLTVSAEELQAAVVEITVQ